MKKAYLKYVSSLLLFGSNGIVASYIALNSYEIVLSRAFIGSLFLICLFVLFRKQLQALKHKKDFLFLSSLALLQEQAGSFYMRPMCK
ncbi:MAG: hypothetical protein ACRCWR_02495 [Saezia sp.]